jgi:hypothetical protein
LDKTTTDGSPCGSPPRESGQRRQSNRERQRARTLPDLDTQRVREHWMELKMKQSASSKREAAERENARRDSRARPKRERGKGRTILLLFILLYINE